MAYITAQEIIDRYGRDYLQIPSDHNGDGLPDWPPITTAIDDASAEIDKFFSTRFVVPLTTVDTDPSLTWVKRCCADLAVYFLSGTWDTMTDLVEKRRDECMLQLHEVAAGTINPGGTIPQSTGGNKLVADTRELTRPKLCWLFP